MVGRFKEALKDTKEFIKTSVEEIVDPFAMDSTQKSVQQPAPNQKATSNSHNAITAVEYVEREKQKCNLIFHNISEPIELASSDQQKQ